MIEICYVDFKDRKFWFSLDRHLSEIEFSKKVQHRQGYIVYKDNMPKGLLRFNFLFDNIPFCTMLFIDKDSQGQGLGRALMSHFEDDMRSQGFDTVLTSTRSDETAQHFYRKLGYKDCGGLIIDIGRDKQPMELFFIKSLL